jgi:transketolase
MTDREIASLKEYAYRVRRLVIEMTTRLGAGHLGGSLSVTDLLTYLYFQAIRQRTGPKRDRLFLSAGHLCPALYATMAEANIIPREELATYGQLDSRLQGHPSRTDLPAVESASGSLGQGLSLALGCAMSQPTARIFCLMSDAEQAEGSTWEAAMAAAHYRASNLVGIIDRNGLQISGSTENVMALNPLRAKYEAFGWQVVEADGHDFASLEQAFTTALEARQPAVIIAQTTMGKGLKNIENNPVWHSKVIAPKHLAQALKNLQK